MTNEELKGEHVGTRCAASNLRAMASTLVAIPPHIGLYGHCSAG